MIKLIIKFLEFIIKIIKLINDKLESLSDKSKIILGSIIFLLLTLGPIIIITSLIIKLISLF